MTIRTNVTLAVDQTRRKLISLKEVFEVEAYAELMRSYNHEEDAQQMYHIETAHDLFDKLIEQLERAR